MFGNILFVVYFNTALKMPLKSYDEKIDRNFLGQGLWLWELHDAETQWLLNEVSYTLLLSRKRKIGGNCTIHIDDNGVPTRCGELEVHKVRMLRERVLQHKEKLSDLLRDCE